MLLEKLTFSVSLIRWSTWSNIFIELQTNCVISIAKKNFENSEYYFKNTKIKNIFVKIQRFKILHVPWKKTKKTNLDQWKELMVFEILMFEIRKYHIDKKIYLVHVLWISSFCYITLVSWFSLQALVSIGNQQALVPKKAMTMPKPIWHPPWKLYRVNTWVICVLTWIIRVWYEHNCRHMWWFVLTKWSIFHSKRQL